MTNKENCAGSYSVNGYTRADGTLVSGYIRTCGAAHNSNYSNIKREDIGLGSKMYNDDEFPIYKRIEEGPFPRYKKISREDLLYPTMEDKKSKKDVEEFKSGAIELLNNVENSSNNWIMPVAMVVYQAHMEQENLQDLALVLFIVELI